MVKELESLFLPLIDPETTLEEASASLDKLERNGIDQVPWPSFQDKTKVSFALAHATDCLLLKFYVNEEAIRARHTKTNEPVYEDSCVEMFIAFEGEKEYYNFEFNLLGSCLSAFGSGREDRKLLAESALARIKSQTVLQRNPQEELPFSWQLTLLIPLEVFCFHKITQLKGLKARGNFFKCGDKLPEAHYLSWNGIKAQNPDFHLAEFFGELHFI